VNHTPRFIDTAFLLAIANSDDQYHSQARILYERWSKEDWRVVTTEAVLLEFLNAMSRPPRRSVALEWVDFLYEEGSVRVIPVNGILFSEGLVLYRNRPDKAWGLTDCISFVVMTHERLYEALTTDQHFTQAGFHVLLQEEKRL
jgi:predicted nucleic acid-binding protein